MAAVLVAVLSGCSTVPMDPTQASPVPPHRVERPELVAAGQLDPVKARITFTRDDGSLQFSGGCGYNVHVNHAPLATLRNGETLSIDVPPGQYAVHFNLTAVLCPAFTSSTVTVFAKAGIAARLRLGLRDGQPFLQPLE